MKAVYLLAAFLFTSSALAAEPCAAAGNLFATNNCGFTKNIDGWTHDDGVGTTAHDPKQGEAAAGSLDVTAVDRSIVIFSPCVVVEASTLYRASVAIRAVSGEIYTCGITGRQYSDGACEKGRERLELSADLLPSSAWETASGEGTTSETARSLRLHLECNGEGEFTVLFDDVIIGRTR